MTERRLVPGHSPYEPVVGYSRAVVAGDRVHVSGTAPIPADGSPPPDGVYEQAKLCLEIVAGALERAGTDLAHVVRTRVYLADASLWAEFARAHGEAFSEVRPANTTVVAQMLDPAWKVEIEVEAVLP
jgi:enamine deaminase RidA (YjgF/YER057c/UK114 family)